MQSSQLRSPLSYVFRDSLLVQEVAGVSLKEAQYLKDAALMTLALIDAAKTVRVDFSCK